MRKTKICTILVLVAIILSACSKDNNSNNFAPLEGNQFKLIINRTGYNPNIQFPRDPFTEDHYSACQECRSYDLGFTFDLDSVSIFGDPVVAGTLTEKSTGQLYYDLVGGLFAGGRFIVWTKNDGFEAELTIYGSGVPVISSERGDLVPAE